ncbi:Glycerol-3-phosphate ABC transporter, substrate-binding protein UgpB [hydrothermal vent metagenome]|uniref:Glycerol-3-phosphate ABC transporter, substrate-binding protein UgpB n=1 Tax=hydrothermal vent metagenome TaxID=652676 RepID=A0A3B0U6R3_9ZZZZ
MKLKNFLLGAVALTTLGGLSVSAQAQTEIQWWHAMGGANGERIDRIAAEFNESQSEYVVVPTFKGNYTETMTAAVAAFRANAQPEIVQVFEVGTATMMAAEGAVYPISELMADAGEPFNINDYLPAVVSYYETVDGELLSMPFNSSTPVLWYNQDAFTEAGVDAPPTTWDEMKTASEKLVAAGYDCGFSFGWQSWVMIENFSAWTDAPIGTLENGYAGLETRLTFNTDALKNRLNTIYEWSKDDLFKYGGRRGDSLSMFTNGECGMWMNSSAYYGSMVAQADFEFSQAMLPLDTDVADAPQNSIIGGATLWVLRGADEEKYVGVAKFLNFLSSAEVQAWWGQETGYVPITTAGYELTQSEGFYEANPGTDVAIKQLSLNTPTANSRGLRFGNFVQIRDIINEEMEEIWAGTKTADQALDDAVERGNELLAKFERANK